MAGAVGLAGQYGVYAVARTPHSIPATFARNAAAEKCTAKERATLVRFVGQAPVEATVFEMERLRCNACGQVFTAKEPEDVGPDKYDATATAMIAQLKYGSGVPFARLERMEGQMGIPLPAATQWELMEQGAAALSPALDQLLWQAAQGEVLHNDDTGMRILRLARAPSDQRTGVFTSGIVSLWRNRKIALFFTGRQHAGENLADVLKRRAEHSSPIQMCDALSRNLPKLAMASEDLWRTAWPMAGGSSWMSVDRFPEQCRHLLETLAWSTATMPWPGSNSLSPEARLRFHQEASGPTMHGLHGWLRRQLARSEDRAQFGAGRSDRLHAEALG